MIEYYYHMANLISLSDPLSLIQSFEMDASAEDFIIFDLFAQADYLLRYGITIPIQLYSAKCDLSPQTFSSIYDLSPQIVQVKVMT